VKSWLKAGVIDGGNLFSTDEGDHREVLMRCEAYSGNALGESKQPRDNTYLKVLRLTQQAGDNE